MCPLFTFRCREDTYVFHYFYNVLFYHILEYQEKKHVFSSNNLWHNSKLMKNPSSNEWPGVYQSGKFVFANFNTAVSINYKNCCCINIYRYSAFCVVCHVSYCSLWYWVSFFFIHPSGSVSMLINYVLIIGLVRSLVCSKYVQPR